MKYFPLAPLAAAVGASFGVTAAETGNSLPNIVYIMCDDMGYGDLGCYGQPYISTPSIDSLARQGMMFTQAYAGSPVSAPSRASLMTGQHTGHTEVRGNREYWPASERVFYGDNEDFSVVGQHPYATNHIILPELMRSRGYRTGVFGKWAGGFEGSPSTPDKRGVDEFYGYICQFQAHLYYPNFLNRYRPELGDTAVTRVVMEQNIQHPMCGPDYAKRSQYSADLIHREALDWIGRQSADKPFFGVFTYTLPHAELVQPTDSILQNYIEKFGNDDKFYNGDCGSRYNATTHTHAQFAAMITRLDSYVGEIMAELRRKGLDRNTIVVFTSDNGPHEEGGADPTFFGRDGKLKGLKRSCHEGGIRIPFIVNWPGVIEPGSVSDHQLAFYDVMPTLAEITGMTDFPAAVANNAEGTDYFDGISFAPTLRGDSKSQRVHEHLYWEFHETDQIGVRRGDWKLVVKRGVPELYNLADDIHEDHNLADSHPEIVAELINVIHREHIDSPLFPITIPAAR